MDTPLEPLLRHLVPSISNVAPEKAAQLQSLIDAHCITFTIDDRSPRFIFFADAVDNSITFGLQALERLWARSFAYVSLYEFMTRLQLENPGALDVDLTTPEIQPGMELLAWAVDVESRLKLPDPGDTSWPPHLPKPIEGAAKLSMENVADELFLCALASIFHHEIGHIHLGHDPRNLPQPTPGLEAADDPRVAESNEIRQAWEKEADAWSTNWLLEGLEEGDDRFLKRALGSSLGYLLIASRSIHEGVWKGRHHPPAWDRVYQNIKQHIPANPVHPIWLFVAYIIQLHLQSLGIHPYVPEIETPEDWVNKLLDHVAAAED